MAGAAAALRMRLRSSLDKTSFLFRTLTTAANTTPPEAAAAAEGAGAAVVEANKAKRKKKKNLFEVAQFLPNWGIGYHMAKTHWTAVSYQITKINLYKDGRHGKAWGIAYKDGTAAADAPKKISGVHKRCWRYIPNSNKTGESNIPNPKQIEVPPNLSCRFFDAVQ